MNDDCHCGSSDVSLRHVLERSVVMDDGSTDMPGDRDNQRLGLMRCLRCGTQRLKSRVRMALGARKA